MAHFQQIQRPPSRTDLIAHTPTSPSKFRKSQRPQFYGGGVASTFANVDLPDLSQPNRPLFIRATRTTTSLDPLQRSLSQSSQSIPLPAPQSYSARPSTPKVAPFAERAPTPSQGVRPQSASSASGPPRSWSSTSFMPSSSSSNSSSGGGGTVGGTVSSSSSTGMRVVHRASVALVERAAKEGLVVAEAVPTMRSSKPPAGHTWGASSQRADATGGADTPSSVGRDSSSSSSSCSSSASASVTRIISPPKPFRPDQHSSLNLLRYGDETPAPPELFRTQTQSVFVSHADAMKQQPPKKSINPHEARFLRHTSSWKPAESTEPQEWMTETRGNFVPLNPREVKLADQLQPAAGTRSYEAGPIRVNSTAGAVIPPGNPFDGTTTFKENFGVKVQQTPVIIRRPITPHLHVPDDRDFLTETQGTYVPYGREPAVLTLPTTASDIPSDEGNPYSSDGAPSVRSEAPLLPSLSLLPPAAGPVESEAVSSRFRHPQHQQQHPHHQHQPQQQQRPASRASTVAGTTSASSASDTTTRPKTPVFLPGSMVRQERGYKVY